MVDPVLSVLLSQTWHSELLLNHRLCDGLILSFTIKTCWCQGTGVTDSCNLSPQEVSLLARKGRRGVRHICIKIATHDVLDLLSSQDVVWLSVRQLDPIVPDVLSDPIYFLVNTISSLLHHIGSTALLSMWYLSFRNEVIVTCTINLAPESERSSSTHSSKSLQTLVQSIVLVLSKRDASPFKHPHLLDHIVDHAR